jgi:hypothetical protein
MLAFALQVHEGESLYLANKWDLIGFGGVAFILLLLIFSDRIPSINIIRQFVEIINTRGGNILLLAFFSWIFFRSAMLFIYHILALAQVDGNTVDKSQAVVTAGLGFVTGSAFGGAWGALLKTMSPTVTVGDNGQENPPPPTADKKQGG